MLTDQFIVTAGLRGVYHKEFDARVTPKVSALYKLNDFMIRDYPSVNVLKGANLLAEDEDTEAVATALYNHYKTSLGDYPEIRAIWLNHLKENWNDADAWENGMDYQPE